MANIKSQIKRNKTNEKRHLRNKSFKSEIKTAVKSATQAIENKQSDSEALVKTACSLLDRAVTKNVYHHNTVARKKANLMKRYQSANQ